MQISVLNIGKNTESISFVCMLLDELCVVCSIDKKYKQSVEQIEQTI